MVSPRTAAFRAHAIRQLLSIKQLISQNIDIYRISWHIFVGKVQSLSVNILQRVVEKKEIKGKVVLVS